MKRWLPVLAAVVFLLGGCSMLPGEERAFAVAMGVGMQDGMWEVCARIPTYQAGGGYATLSGEGVSLGEAMAKLNASAPMELHYGQTRLLVFGIEVAESDGFQELVNALSARGEIRPQAAIAITAEPVGDIMDALVPETGSRLSKSLDSLLDARERSGAMERVTLASWLRMGRRQQPVLPCVILEEAKDAKNVQFSGGWMQGDTGKASGILTSDEMQLLALMKGKLRQGTLSLPEGTLTLLDTHSRIRLTGGEARCSLQIRYSAASLTEQGVQTSVDKALRDLTGKLSNAGCDALGIARKAMRGVLTMADWQAMNWPDQYRMLTWRFTVKAERET